MGGKWLSGLVGFAAAVHRKLGGKQMILKNAQFHPVEYWKKNKVNSLEAALDFARCLEDTAYTVLHQWHVYGEKESKPTNEEFESSPQYRITEKNDCSALTGWLGTRTKLPWIARFFPQEQWGNWGVTLGSWYDPDLYCDDVLFASYVFQRGEFDTGVGSSAAYMPMLSMRIPSPQTRNVGECIVRNYLLGLGE